MDESPSRSRKEKVALKLAWDKKRETENNEKKESKLWIRLYEEMV